MKNKRLIFLLCGIFCASLILAGLCLLVFSKSFATVSGIVVICLSLATGLIAPNPVSIAYLLAGILMWVLPKPVPAIILLVLGVAGAVANLIVWLKKKSVYA